ncbi:MAG TPA: PAS domain S-box protein [Gemmatimonadaceae bacterium]|nr:PAS domain S-box protein [Gemmatimonadaceae bacterium]
MGERWGRILLERASEMLCASGPNGEMLYVNAAWQRALGYTLAEAAAMRPVDFVVPEDRERYVKVARTVVTGLPVDDFEATLLAKDGRRVLCRGWAVADMVDGVYCGSVAGYRDCTAERAVQGVMVELAQSESRFRRLSDASTDGVVISRDGVVLEVNAAWCRLFGVSEKEAVGTRAESYIAPHERDATRRIMAENRPLTYTITLLRPDGSTFEAEVSGRPIDYGGQAARISIVRDVSAWMRVNRLKSEFVSTVSHELRTPLTAIHGSLKLLESGAIRTDSAQAAQLVTMARANSERLVRLINDMLDLDKIEAGRVELRRQPLLGSEVVRVTLDSLAATAAEQRVGLVSRVIQDTSFSADRDRTLQVLTNLVSNAIKFATPGSEVRVTISRESTMVRIAVTNVGDGISAADLSRLFARFQQLDGSDARRHGGTGLGLAIAKAIVEQHGGRIGVESERRAGAETTFWIEMPITRSSAGARVVA